MFMSAGHFYYDKYVMLYVVLFYTKPFFSKARLAAGKGLSALGRMPIT